MSCFSSLVDFSIKNVKFILCIFSYFQSYLLRLLSLAYGALPQIPTWAQATPLHKNVTDGRTDTSGQHNMHVLRDKKVCHWQCNKKRSMKIKNSGSINLYNDVWCLIYYIATTNKTAFIHKLCF